MATAIDVMKYIKSRQQVYGEMQVHKLVYFAQAWSLAWDGSPLFGERIEAWEKGPVVRALRFRTDAADGDVLEPSERETVDAVLAMYGHLNGTQLGELTHDQAPWSDVWEQRGDRDWCDDEIPHDLMRRFYTKESMEGRSPKREVSGHQVASDDTREIAAANAERWSEALELLSR